MKIETEEKFTQEERVKKLTEQFHAEQIAWEQFGTKYGFYRKRPENTRNSLILKFNYGKKEVDRQRLTQGLDFIDLVKDRFGLKHKWSMGLNHQLVEVGIYETYYWSTKHWIIPDELVEVQDFVSHNAPTWVSQKRK